MRIVPLILGALGVLMVSSVASAQSVERGRRAYLDAEFEGAVTAFEAVLDSPSLTHADAIEATRYLTALELMLGHEARARDHGRTAVALDPEAHAPEGSPPEAEALLRELAEEGDGVARLTIRGEGGSRVAAHLAPIPEGLITRLRLRCAGESAEGEPPSIVVESSSDGTVQCAAEAATDAGAALFATEETVTLGGVALTQETNGSDEGGAPLWPWLVAGAGALVAIAIVVVVVAVASGGGGDQAAFGDTRVEGW